MSKLFPTCSDCICYHCLYYWSFRCPHGGCYDDYRARYNPYTVHHMGDPPRKTWSYWDRPGEQQHWCRGGAFYPVDQGECEHYVHYEGQMIQTCLKANVAVFQDGYIECSMINCYGCERCYEEFERRQEAND